MSTGDAIGLIEQAANSFLEEVPSLKPMKVVVGIDLHGRGDTQQFRLEMPAVKVTKGYAEDSRIKVEMRRDFFNLMVEGGAKLPDWYAAFYEGKAKATGVEQYLQLITRVVEKQSERNRTKRARS